MLLARQRRQQHARNAGLAWKCVNRGPQRRLQLLSVQMLLEYLQLPAHPSVADSAI